MSRWKWPAARPLGRVALALAVATLGSSLLSAQVLLGVETFDVAWTTVRDSHFDKTMNGVNWDGVRAELRPRAAAAKSNAELRAVVRDMLGRLGQSHFALIPSSVDAPPDASHVSADLSADVGFDVRLVGGDLLVTSVESTVVPVVRPGWRIIEIAGTPIVDLLRTLREGHGRPEAVKTSSEGANDRLLNVEAWRIAQTRLRGRAGSTVALTFENGQGALVRSSLERRPEQGQPVTVGSLPTMFVRVESERKQTPGGKTAGVIRFNVWMAAVDTLFQKAVDEFRAADGIIIDLRGNPGGLAGMMMGISGHFVGERKTLGVMKTRENPPLEFRVNPRLVSAAGERVQPFAGPVAILVDAMSGSASECFAGGMQSIGRVRVFGQPSMGQALPALFDRMPNGDVLIHAYGDFVTADGTRLEGRGVIPDQIVPLLREDLLAGRYRTLDAALAWIDRPKDVQ